MIIKMFEYLKYKRTLQKLRKEQFKVSKELEQVSTNATTPDDYAEGSSIYQEEEKITKWIEFLQTKYYKRICENLIIPVPDNNDDNLYCKYDFDNNEGEVYIFTTKGFYHIRKLIREERKEICYWISIITGLIGVLIGLIAIIKK